MSVSPLAQETISASEAGYTEIVCKYLKAKIVRDNAAGIMRRDVHLKMHGVVKAEFIVDPNLPPELRIGVFREPRTYPAWIRFSNASTSIDPDINRDIRGMAIKVMDLAGDKLLEHRKHEQTQDFILISASVFPTRDVKEFHGLAESLFGSLLAKIWFFLTHWRVAWILFKTFRKFANPLQIRYFSATPYLFGGGNAVKYSAIPPFRAPEAIPDPPSDDYLRLAVTRHLREGEALFDFTVQFQTDAQAMPIEDPRIEWPESMSPFRKVATIRIPRQDCDGEAQRRFGENLSFTPWHSLPEHRPLGGINRARKVIYEAISTFRHEYNHAPRKEPTSWEI